MQALGHRINWSRWRRVYYQWDSLASKPLDVSVLLMGEGWATSRCCIQEGMKSITNEPHILLFSRIFCLLPAYSALIRVEGRHAGSGWRLSAHPCTQVRVSKVGPGIQIGVESVPPH